MSERGIPQKPYPAATGISWLRRSLAVLRSQALRLLVLALVLQFMAGLSQVGLLALLFLLAMPVFSAGMLQAVALAGRGERPAIATLFVAFSSPPQLLRLLGLGGLGLLLTLMLVGSLLSGALSDIDPGLMARLQAGDAQAVGEMDPAVLQDALLALALGMVLAGVLLYFAVPLVWFHRLGPWRALLVGLGGMLRHWRAMLVMGLLLAALLVPVALLVGFSLSAQAAPVPAMMTLVAMLAMATYQLLLFASQQVSFAAIFGMPAAAPVAEDQLVA